jgi:hypothetical protein
MTKAEKVIHANYGLVMELYAEGYSHEYVGKLIGLCANSLARRFPEFNRKGKYEDAKLRLEYEKCPKACKHCKTSIEYPDRRKIFCNRSCAAIFNNNVRQANKHNSTIVRKSTVRKPGKNYKKYTEVCCEFCGRIYNRAINSKTKHCSRICWKSQTDSKLTERKLYAKNCKFIFNVYHYPEFYDISLINKYGWYSPSNKSNNLGGVSRDHRISIQYGFKHRIDPSIISHPANCRLVLHIDNQKKKCGCDISLEALMKEIESFDKKYRVNI